MVSSSAEVSHDVGAQELIDAARALRPQIIAEAPQAEKRTFFSEDLHRKFLDARLYDIYVPKRYGGLELDMRAFVNVVKEVSRGDMSTGWCFGLSANHAVMAASVFSQNVQNTLFRNGFRASSTINGVATARKVDGGWKLNGTVRYCSGSPYSNFYIGIASIVGDDPATPAQPGVFVAPASAYTRLDDWGAVLGLKGSGSHSLKFQDAIIPDEYVIPGFTWMDVPVEQGTVGYRLHGNPLYASRCVTFFTMSIAAVSIGGGLAALDEYADQMRKREVINLFDGSAQSRMVEPYYQAHYGAASTQLYQAELMLDTVAERHLEMARLNAQGKRPFTIYDDLRLSGVAREIMINVWETVDQHIFRSIGASVIQYGKRFEQIFRDLAQASSHYNPSIRDASFRSLAQMELDPKSPFKRS
ncbi:MAG TPA: acyl-CoA dehydrogenase family protein [Steroidobacteraceae bacterium]|jgi:3-hydroxy-9,10-secoandrosta-1,3,5(10)-triene-9,17-dione monooxygenase|nr:acyl-CoA dehydrogenase family protein [Steroidobacteraceae bacterium]